MDHGRIKKGSDLRQNEGDGFIGSPAELEGGRAGPVVQPFGNFLNLLGELRADVGMVIQCPGYCGGAYPNQIGQVFYCCFFQSGGMGLKTVTKIVIINKLIKVTNNKRLRYGLRDNFQLVNGNRVLKKEGS